MPFYFTCLQNTFNHLLHKLAILSLLFLLTACTQNPNKTDMKAADLDQAGVSRIVKSDIDEVAELHQRAVMEDLKSLMLKLYRRNPGQRFDKDRRSIEESVDLVFKRPFYYGYSHWEGMTGSEIIQLAVDPNYRVNDRVLPFIVGLRKMLMASYNNELSFNLLSNLDEQKLYNSARNIEVAAWLLAVRKDKQGQLLILSDSLADETRNLTFQRLIGKMIATQDNMAKIISHKEGRMVKAVVLRAASMAFLPI